MRTDEIINEIRRLTAEALVCEGEVNYDELIGEIERLEYLLDPDSFDGGYDE